MKKEQCKSKISAGIILMIFGLAFGSYPIITGSTAGNIILFVLVGTLVFFAGIVNIVNETSRIKAVRNLIYRNEYIYADFDSIRETYHTEDASNFSTYSAIFSYKDECGKKHFFKSDEYIDIYSVPFKHGDIVKVYVDLSDPKIYMVSLNDHVSTKDKKCDNKEKEIGSKEIAAGLIAGGIMFILVPFIMGITVILTSEAFLPLYIFMFLFFAVFAVIGTASIVKGVLELSDK